MSCNIYTSTFSVYLSRRQWILFSGRKNSLCPSLITNPFIPPSFNILFFLSLHFWPPVTLPFLALLLPIARSLIYQIPKTSHCPSLPHPPLLVASPHPLTSLILFLSIPLSPSLSLSLSLSLSVSIQAFLPLVLLRSLFHWVILSSHQEGGGGGFDHSHAKRLTTCHEKIVECQGHKIPGSGKKVTHCVHPAFMAWTTGLPHLLVHCRERVGWLGMGSVRKGGQRGQGLSLLRFYFSTKGTWCLAGVLMTQSQSVWGSFNAVKVELKH